MAKDKLGACVSKKEDALSDTDKAKLGAKEGGDVRKKLASECSSGAKDVFFMAGGREDEWDFVQKEVANEKSKDAFTSCNKKAGKTPTKDQRKECLDIAARELELNGQSGSNVAADLAKTAQKFFGQQMEACFSEIGNLANDLTSSDGRGAFTMSLFKPTADMKVKMKQCETAAIETFGESGGRVDNADRAQKEGAKGTASLRVWHSVLVHHLRIGCCNE